MRRGGDTPDGDFARLVLPHLDSAYRLALWLLRDRAAAEDVAQDAMVRAMTYLHGFRGENPRAWLLQIVRTTAYTRIAAQRGGRETPLDDTVEHTDPGDTPELALEKREGEGVLARGLASLSTELRECLVLRELEEMSYRDIARITEVPIGTVMSRLWRAREALMAFGRSLA